MATLYAGTSGFAYPSWKPDFYPDKMPRSRFLAYYAGRLNAVEVNYTFRRLPSEKTLHKWAEATPEGFVFAVKAHQRITHFQRLQDVEELTGVFLDALEPLRAAGKLGPLLFQLPPSFTRDDEHLERLVAFLAFLRAGRDSTRGDQGPATRGPGADARQERPVPAERRPATKASPASPAGRIVVELRDGSWFVDDVFGLLREHGVALCVTDSETLEVPDVATAGFAYYRLRREEYADADVDRWCERAREQLAAGRDTYVMLKHEDDPRGALQAEQLLTGGRRRV